LEDRLRGILRILVAVVLHRKNDTFKKILNGNSLRIIGIKVIPIDFGFEYNFLGFVIFQLFDNEEGIRNSNDIEVSEIPTPDEQLQFFRALLTSHAGHTPIMLVGKHIDFINIIIIKYSREIYRKPHFGCAILGDF
jgi:hypothetical protein